jgi:hypothetical protein
MMRRLAGVVVFLLIMPPFMVLAWWEIAGWTWSWLRTGDSHASEKILDDRRWLNRAMALPGKVGGWK